MEDWRPKPADLKRYPHFDSPLAIDEIVAIVTNPKRVAENSFYPLMRYSKGWQPFRAEDSKPKRKDRPIRYAARRDAYIYAYYRHLLSIPYEAELRRRGIESCPIAYRRISAGPGGKAGKCNIHFAKDAIDRIRELGDCCVIALDISSYFESIDHERLRMLWCQMIGKDRLPDDHFAVFKAITRYSFVEKTAVYERLGFFGEKRVGHNGKKINGFLTPYTDLPKQLCSPHEFRQKILGENGLYPSLVQRNTNSWGIPQGAPISDLLANLYLIDFDFAMHLRATSLGGTYYRYSDDIIFVLPVPSSEAAELMREVGRSISLYGEQLVIKPEKSSLLRYRKDGENQTYQLLAGAQGSNGLEYLGFRYDGRKVFLRDSTLSSLYRKIAFAARNQADVMVRRYPSKDLSQLIDLFDFEAFTKRFGRIEDFEEAADVRSWTFWTYATRAADAFGSIGAPIRRQVAGHKQHIKRRVAAELERALLRRGARAATESADLSLTE